ncbi:hypothetical protein SLEP1_g42208 [Rubroshorea leprosula]|uniref:Transmembrane protein n=1 Tax=Rubroshorea leprosula TaxID=152421 RepID=A0AAV5L9Z1_9ROSI|nr:hypothetical protein SLEP1_g42208 [Rubroshorea leprosula]
MLELLSSPTAQACWSRLVLLPPMTFQDLSVFGSLFSDPFLIFMFSGCFVLFCVLVQFVFFSSGNPRLFFVDLGRGLLVFSISCSVWCRSSSLLSPPTDLWRRVRGLPDLMPIAALLLVSRDCRRLIGLPLGILEPDAISSKVDRRVSRIDRSTEGRDIS